MSGPLKPEELENHKAAKIPEKVFEVFNDLITKHWNGSSATIEQREIVAALAKRMDIDSSEVFWRQLLNVEFAYTQVGWKVEYDKPSFNETYEATFTFTKKK